MAPISLAAHVPWSVPPTAACKSTRTCSCIRMHMHADARLCIDENQKQTLAEHCVARTILVLMSDRVCRC